MAKLIGVRTCDNCGKDVEIYHKERMNRMNIFCSKICEGEYRKSQNPNYIQCAVCGAWTYKNQVKLKEVKLVFYAVHTNA